MKKNIFFIFFCFTQLLLYSLPSVMVTGYWDPTGQMIAPFSLDPELNPDGWIGDNWQEMGYDVFSYFPMPGEYTGDFEVDYQDTWEDFWDIVAELEPIAIISFGAGTGPWEIETKARNLTNWVPDNEIPYMPTPNPPDDTVPVGFIRYSTLPYYDIEEQVDSNTTLNAWIDFNGYAGAYLCEYMFYLGTWYQGTHDPTNDLDTPCLAAGFIHVNSGIGVDQAQEAAFITIETVLEYLNTFVDVNGIIASDEIDPTGTNLMLSGTNDYSVLIDNPAGTFELPYVAGGLYDIAAFLDNYYYAYTQMEINESNNYIELELEDWSTEDIINYGTEPVNMFEGLPNANYEICCRYTQEELAGLDNSVLGKISFLTPTSSDSCSLWIKIYEEEVGDLSASNLVYEEEMDDFNGNEILEHYLSIPIQIQNDKEYWVGYAIEALNGFEGWFDTGPMIEEKGAWVKRGIWRQIDYYYDQPGNWLINAHVFSPVSNIAQDDQITPLVISLKNSPNPFNPVTQIKYCLTRSTYVELNIYNLKGQKIKNLVSAQQTPGDHIINWDGADSDNKQVTSGVYFYSLKTDQERLNRKMVLIK